MARHIMAVCVVCLLCAQRLHCQDHIGDMLVTQRTDIKLNARLAYGNLSPSSEITTDQRQLADEDDTQNYSTSPPYRRHKRHAGHEHEHDHSSPHTQVPQITEHFLQQLMQQQTLNASSFRSLLQKLGLQQLVSSNESVSYIRCKFQVLSLLILFYICSACQLSVWCIMCSRMISAILATTLRSIACC